MSRHLGLQVSAYVDRRLDATLLRAFDQHLVACQVCCYAAEQERRLLASLRHGPTPGLSEGLQSMLLGLGSPGECGAADESAPMVPQRLVVRPVSRPVPTVAPAAPALHRSPRRAALFAGLAASASAAAAIGIAVAAPTSATVVPRSPVSPPRSTWSISADTAAFLTTSRVVPLGSVRLADKGGR